MQTELRMARVPAAHAAQVVDVLCEAFRDYPVMRYVLGDAHDYERRLQQMIGLFVAARALRDDVMLGFHHGAELVAVATTSDPAAPAHPDFARLRDEVWASLGADALERYQHCVAAWESLASHAPQLHINMLGVRDAVRGTGLGRRLVAAVHALAGNDARCTGVSLTTETPANVPFYQHLGYQIIGEAGIAPGLRTWSFFWTNKLRPADFDQRTSTS